MNQLHIEFDIPATVAAQAGLSPENANREARRILALFLYEHRRISLGKACELAGLSQWEFFELNQELNIEQPISEAELKADLSRLNSV